MAVTSTLSLALQYTGDVALQDTFSITANATASGQSEVIDLASGANTITVPTGGASTVQGVIIIPPAGNTTAITLKGVTGDTGVAMGLTDPAALTLGSAVTDFVLTAGGAITGVRLLYF